MYVNPRYSWIPLLARQARLDKCASDGQKDTDQQGGISHSICETEIFNELMDKERKYHTP